MPSDYQYDDALPIKWSNRKYSLEKSRIPMLKMAESSTIDLYAQWMTTWENPRFSKVIANRMWKHNGPWPHRTGRSIDCRNSGIVSRIDGLPESLIQTLDYDLKQFQRILLPPPIPAVDGRQPDLPMTTSGRLWPRQNSLGLLAASASGIGRVRLSPLHRQPVRVRCKGKNLNIV